MCTCSGGTVDQGLSLYYTFTTDKGTFTTDKGTFTTDKGTCSGGTVDEGLRLGDR